MIVIAVPFVQEMCVHMRCLTLN